MTGPHDFGRTCEQLAAGALVAAGWTIIARNYRFGHREIDLVARRRDITAFVEVKGRRSLACGHPLEAITWKKRAEIRRVAEHWIARHGVPGSVYRFDAIAITDTGGGAPRIDHIEDAWRL